MEKPAGVFTVPRQLLETYGGNAPRYTSYPTAPTWQDGDWATAWRHHVGVAGAGEMPLSLYVHIPFCKSLCHYCGCNMMVTRNASLVDRYLDALEKEMDLAAAALGQRKKCVQLHLGGGTPTHLTSVQLTRLVTALEARFDLQHAQRALEVHPPVTSLDQVKTLASLGFTRVSMGVQDFDPQVQDAVHRHQPFEQTQALVEQCRKSGAMDINMDLMYGLPLQTPESFSATARQVLQIRPETVALFGYAHVPSLKPHQKLLEQHGLPTPEQRLDLFELAARVFTAAGYHHVGLDHFALPHSELWQALSGGALRRNFMGYTTAAHSHVLALGASSISDVAGAYFQNDREVEDYLQRLESGQSPLTRGMVLSPEDLLRRDLIMELFCHLAVDTGRLGQRHGITFETHFSTELELLRPMVKDGLVTVTPGKVAVTAGGQVFLRQVAAVFDAYLQGPKDAKRPMSQAV